jgi:hypothetical protein
MNRRLTSEREDKSGERIEGAVEEMRSDRIPENELNGDQSFEKISEEMEPAVCFVGHRSE